MRIKTIQWNIGGGKIRESSSDPLSDDSYNIDGLSYIEQIIKKHNPDIIFLQETHQGEDPNQAKELSVSLGLKHYFNDIYDKSHLEKGQKLGQAIISRFPIENHKFEFFLNPKLEVIHSTGEKWISHNKGISSCFVKIGEKTILQLKTLHLVPFRRFNIDPLSHELAEVRKDIVEKIKCSTEKFLLQGDFNYNDFSLRRFLPDIFSNGVSEVILNEPTTAKGRKYEHIIYKGLKHCLSEVITNTLTDHFPVYSEFEI